MAALSNAESPVPATSPGLTTTGNQGRRAATAAFLGSMLEYYDFFIYGSAAALIFPALFFPSGNSTAATIAALATFGVGYLARPLGGLVFGHFGDRIGRKRMLVITLTVMGLGSVAIGLLPTYQQIGVAAPVLLVVARLAQGFSAGGEAAGASTLTIEHAPPGHRGLFASSTMSGCMAGIVFANLVFVPMALLPGDALMSWGWRVPFLSSFIVLVIAYLVRRRLDEPPVFIETVQKDETANVPVKELLRTQWADVLRVAFAALFAVFQSVFMVFGLSYGTAQAGVSQSTMLWIIATSHAAAVLGVPLAAALSDRIGRRPVWIAGALSSVVMTFAFFWSVSTGQVILMFLTGVLLIGGTYSGMNGLWPAMFSEQFAAPVRYSGFALGHGSGLMVAAFAPTICAAIAGPGSNGWVPVAMFVAVSGCITATAAFFCRETHDVPLDELGAWRRHVV